MKVLPISPEGTPEDGMFVYAIMLRPWDGAWQKRFVSAAKNRAILSVAKKKTAENLPRHAMQTVIDAACGERFEQYAVDGGREIFSGKYNAGEMAARILIFVLSCADNDPENASLEHAYSCHEEAFVKARIKGASRSQLTEKVWKRYRDVAHLWAAMMIREDLWRAAANDKTAWLEWLGLAEHFREKAVAHRHPRSKAPLVPPMAMWRAPDSMQPLPPWEGELPHPSMLIDEMSKWRDLSKSE